MRLFHGTASLDAVLEGGLHDRHGERVFDASYGALGSHGGVYLTGEPGCAAAFAARAAAAAASSPCVLVVDASGCDLLVDEDSLSHVAKAVLGRGLDGLMGMEPDELAAQADGGGLDMEGAELARRLGARGEEALGPCVRYLAALADALAEDSVTDGLVSATVELSRACPRTLTEDWARANAVPAHNVRAVGCDVPVVGWVRLTLSADGTEAVSAESWGDVGDDEADGIVRSMFDAMDFKGAARRRGSPTVERLGSPPRP